MSVPRILVVGSFSMDLTTTTGVFPASGETVLGKGFTTAPGGKGNNQAVQAARLGAQVTMVGKVGMDSFGDQVLAAAEKAGVNVKQVLRDDQGTSTGIATILLEEDEAGQRHNRIIVVGGSNMTLTVEDVAFLEQGIADFDMVLLQFEIPMAVNVAVAQWAKKVGVPVMVNPAPAAAIPAELLRCTTYLSPNEHEAAALTGIPIRTESRLNKGDAQAACDALRRRGVAHVLITLGENGAALGDNEGLHYMPSVPDALVADPTAAGDSFVAAFCVGICIGLNQMQAMDFARNAAAVTISRIGAQPSLPDLPEVMEILDYYGALDFPRQALASFAEEAKQWAAK